MYRKAEIREHLKNMEEMVSELETRGWEPKENVELKDLAFLPESRVVEVYERVDAFVKSVTLLDGGKKKKIASLRGEKGSRGVGNWKGRILGKVFGRKKKAASEPTRVAKPKPIRYCHETRQVSQDAIDLAGLRVRLVCLEKRYDEKRMEKWPEATILVEQRLCREMPLLDDVEPDRDSGVEMRSEATGGREGEGSGESTSVRQDEVEADVPPLFCVQLYDAPWSDDEA
ncbi:hypothetical protein CKM354_000420400 [Cercospora kikuchii]|uniref:Uncharacterized protein n=1 Tax=Cercospora kikuchii TaxID=84275 RepID=A0A9P3CDP3_9PEZI|nr:uncharacterized protein CKM354_000420400 [Cercospora kikuchii]GIZ40883.1 hypothetical protein CKM354_000420400 [Cercospora kikuchii]